jgi:hypothetical protein
MQKPADFGPFKFLWKVKLEYDPKAATALTQPILLDRIIGFRGFKSIAFVGTQSETVHAIDIDMGSPLWKYHINYSASPPPVLNMTTECPGGRLAAAAFVEADDRCAGSGGCGGLAAGAGRSGSGVGEAGMARPRWRPRVSNGEVAQGPAAGCRPGRGSRIAAAAAGTHQVERRRRRVAAVVLAAARSRPATMRASSAATASTR